MINTTAPHQSGFRRFLSLINLAAVSAVMLAASGCHKDSFNFDEITRPTISGPTTNPDDDETPGPPDFVVSAATNVGEITAFYGFVDRCDAAGRRRHYQPSTQRSQRQCPGGDANLGPRPFGNCEKRRHGRCQC